LEAEEIPASQLGSWLSRQYFDLLCERLKQENYGHILREETTAEDVMAWYEGEVNRLHEQIQKNMGTAKEEFYRQELNHLRETLHKPVIYANWDWHTIVEDALYQAGFSSFAEQEQAMQQLLSSLA
jgi:pyruvate,water dikinase